MPSAGDLLGPALGVEVGQICREGGFIDPRFRKPLLFQGRAEIMRGQGAGLLRRGAPGAAKSAVYQIVQSRQEFLQKSLRVPVQYDHSGFHNLQIYEDFLKTIGPPPP